MKQKLIFFPPLSAKMTENCCQALRGFNLGFIVFIFITPEEWLSNVIQSRAVLCQARTLQAWQDSAESPRSTRNCRNWQPGVYNADLIILTAMAWPSSPWWPGHWQDRAVMLRERAKQEGALAGPRRSHPKLGQHLCSSQGSRQAVRASSAHGCQNKIPSRPTCAKWIFNPVEYFDGWEAKGFFFFFFNGNTITGSCRKLARSWKIKNCCFYF